MPPPAGLGGNEGQSGGLDALKPGLANPFGFAGGMRGLNVPGGFGGRSGATRERRTRRHIRGIHGHEPPGYRKDQFERDRHPVCTQAANSGVA